MTSEILTETERFFEQKAGISIALVGSGGKTSLMRYLACRLPAPVVCTTSTKLSSDEVAFFDQHVIWNDNQTALPFSERISDNLLVTGEPVIVDGIQKRSGLTEEQLHLLNQHCYENRFSLIIEADGSKRRPLKAPAEWEPVIPAFTDLVIVVVGLAGLMKPLNDEHVFRSQFFSQLTGLEIGQGVDLRSILQYLKHPMGGFKGIPVESKRFVLFNLAWCECPELIDSKLINKELSGLFDGIFLEDLSLSALGLSA